MKQFNCQTFVCIKYTFTFDTYTGTVYMSFNTLYTCSTIKCNHPCWNINFNVFWRESRAVLCSKGQRSFVIKTRCRHGHRHWILFVNKTPNGHSQHYEGNYRSSLNQHLPSLCVWFILRLHSVLMFLSVLLLKCLMSFNGKHYSAAQALQQQYTAATPWD